MIFFMVRKFPPPTVLSRLKTSFSGKNIDPLEADRKMWVILFFSVFFPRKDPLWARSPLL